MIMLMKIKNHITYQVVKFNEYRSIYNLFDFATSTFFFRVPPFFRGSFLFRTWAHFRNIWVFIPVVGILVSSTVSVRGKENGADDEMHCSLSSVAYLNDYVVSWSIFFVVKKL